MEWTFLVKNGIKPRIARKGAESNYGIQTNLFAMITILGEKYKFCDGVTRRSFLKIGGLTMGGLALPQILQAEEKQGIKRSHKAVINIFLPGGPPHQDMWDMKPNAPKEIRGELKEIPTNIPGTRICELLPRMAKMMDKFTVIRSMFGA